MSGSSSGDITERKEMELELRHLSEHDPLTSIYNRRNCSWSSSASRGTRLGLTTPAP